MQLGPQLLSKHMSKYFRCVTLLEKCFSTKQNVYLWMIKLLVLNKNYHELLIVSSNRHCWDRHTAQTFPLESESAVLWLLVENAASLLLSLAWQCVWLVGAVAGFPQQRSAENANDAQVEDEADDQRPDGP